jgi:MHS family alpha-ketoglutarate permease-like MFS transporter
MQKYLVNTAHIGSPHGEHRYECRAVHLYDHAAAVRCAVGNRIGAQTRLFGVLTVLTVVPLMQAIGSVKSPYMAYV